MRPTTIFISILSLLLLSLPLTRVQAVEKVADATARLAGETVQPQKDTRVLQLRSYLASNKSPLTDSAAHFVEEADRNGLDWKLVASIAGLESTFGKHVPAGSHNAWGWGIPTGASKGIGFASWEQGITTVSEGLRKNYINRGADTVEKMGRIYAASPTWAARVKLFMAKIDEYKPIDPEHIEFAL